jgi:hypothetical protein
MVNGKQRRPIGMRDDVPAYDPRNDPHPDGRGTMGRVAFFEYREDAVEAAKEWVVPQGWEYHPQYVARYDLWMLFAKRKSWPTGRDILVEACLNPFTDVRLHAHVPMKHAFERLGI